MLLPAPYNTNRIEIDLFPSSTNLKGISLSIDTRARDIIILFLFLIEIYGNRARIRIFVARISSNFLPRISYESPTNLLLFSSVPYADVLSVGFPCFITRATPFDASRDSNGG